MGLQVPVSQVRIAGVCANDDGSGGGGVCPMGWVRPNGAQRGRAVGETVGGGGGRGSPMDLGRSSGDPRGPVGRVLLWWGCAQRVSGAEQ